MLQAGSQICSREVVVMSQGDLLKLFLLSELNWAISMFGSMMITRVSCGLVQFLAIVTLPTLAVVLLPLGALMKIVVATVLMYVLIVKLTDAKVFPDGFLLVGVANVLYLIIGISLLARFG